MREREDIHSDRKKRKRETKKKRRETDEDRGRPIRRAGAEGKEM